jgi:hypothetical protein
MITLHIPLIEYEERELYKLSRQEWGLWSAYSALIYFLIETIKANGQEPLLWLTEVFSELTYAQTADDGCRH